MLSYTVYEHNLNFHVGWASVFLPTLPMMVGNKRTLPTLHKSSDCARAEYTRA